MEEPLRSGSGEPVMVRRWPTEIPLFILVILASIALWVLLAITIIGFVYALLIGLLFFFGHLAFVAHVRGSAVRLSADQFPELHRRVEALADRAGLARPPEAYLLQAGGALNALATRFLRSKFLVLYSDLLEACGEDTAARDMIIGHEIGHIRAGHLNGMWLLAPGFFVPFLGAACSRAREYTCDRYGLALCGDPRGALSGLAVLAAGRERGPYVNVKALARQRAGLNTGFMTLGKWLASHPPLCDRVAALDPALAEDLPPMRRGPARAAVAVFLFFAGWAAWLGYFVLKELPAIRKTLSGSAARGGRMAAAQAFDPIGSGGTDSAGIQGDLETLAAVAEEFRNATGKYPANSETLYGFWKISRPDQPPPIDPFTHQYYLFEPSGDQFLLWSTGPDRVNGTADDIHFFGGAKVPPPN
ncbi:MAG TPA: M48 family metallopeptidase [Thermoanaerobaculia bacterium]